MPTNCPQLLTIIDWCAVCSMHGIHLGIPLDRTLIGSRQPDIKVAIIVYQFAFVETRNTHLLCGATP